MELLEKYFKYLYYKNDKDIVLTDGSETENKLLSLYRSVILSMTSKDGKVFLGSHWDTKDVLREDIKKIDRENNLNIYPDDLGIDTVYAILQNYVVKILEAKGLSETEISNKKTFLIPKKRDELIEEAVEKVINSDRGGEVLNELKEEITFIQRLYLEESCYINHKNKPYLKNNDNQTNENMFKGIYKIFEEYKKLRNEKNKLFDREDISWFVLENSSLISEEDKLAALILYNTTELSKSYLLALKEIVKKDGSFVLVKGANQTSDEINEYQEYLGIKK